MLQMFPTLCLIRPISPQRSGSALADQQSQASVIPTTSRIDTDNFQYEGVLSKIERVGLGEKVDAGEEEEQEEIFKVRPACSQRIQARLGEGRAGSWVFGDKSGPGIRKPEGNSNLPTMTIMEAWAMGWTRMHCLE